MSHKMNPTKPLTAPEAFFFEHAGYSHDQGESPEAGRTRGAVALAQAEWAYLEAHRAGNVECVWEHDPDAAFDAQKNPDIAQFETCERASLVRMDTKEYLCTLSSVLDADTAYKRVVRAELALECLERLKELAHEHPEVPNMDGMTQKELITWCHENMNPTAYADTITQLRTYAVSKAAAMTHRELGNIAFATPLEDLCDKIHEQLPAWARW